MPNVDNLPSVGQELGTMPIATLVQSLGEGIANAQFKLDKTSIDITRMIADKTNHPIDLGGQTYSLLELGFAPTFYQFVDTTLEIKMAVSMRMEQDSQQEYNAGYQSKSRYHCYTAAVNAGYTSKFSYSVEGSSVMRTKLIVVPTPAILEERLRKLLET